MTINNKINKLREQMKSQGVAAYVVPTCDFHGSEYIGEYFKAREYISGFTGSAGTLVITMNKSALWTDGRYFLQGEEQLKGTEIELMKSGEVNVPTIYEYLKKELNEDEVIGFDGKTISSNVAFLINNMGLKINNNMDLVGDIWENRPALSCEKVWKLPLEYAGVSADDKIDAIRKELKINLQDMLVITALDEIAWVLNLRGNDVANTPVFLSFLVINQEKVHLFIQKEAVSSEVSNYLLENNIIVHDYFLIYDYLKKITDEHIWIDENSANFNIIKSICKNNKVLNKFTPALNMKAIKNETEIANEKKAHILDGIAMTKFLYWLKNERGNESEISIGKKLECFRKMAHTYIEPSFDSIVAYNEHGAIVHYSATEKTDKKIDDSGIVLIDSGGHYFEGTTDITRTISLGQVTDKMREMYTTVLKGHLNLSNIVFKEGCSGVALDYIARKPLWDKGLDYNHGTGHGVGYLLGVHESPNAIRYRILDNPQFNPLFKAGMITSNEPGIYIEGEFGIRIENLILCKLKEKNKFGKFLEFEDLTLVPYDKELIDKNLLTKKELELLEKYNNKVYHKIAPYLTTKEKDWLKNEIL